MYLRRRAGVGALMCAGLVGTAVTSGCVSGAASRRPERSDQSSTVGKAVQTPASLVDESTPDTPFDPVPNVDAPALSWLDWVLLDGRSLEEIDFQIQTEVKDCMVAAGWEYYVSASAPPSKGTVVELERYRHEYGYGISVAVPTVMEQYSAVDRNIAYTDSLSTPSLVAYGRALNGPQREGSGYRPGEEQGCLPRAESVVTADIPFYQPEFQGIQQEFLTSLLSDERYLTAVANWAQCMADAGYSFSSPDEVESQLRRQWNTLDHGDKGAEEAQQRIELDVASVDLSCQRSHLLGPKQIVERQIIQRLVDAGRLPSDALTK